jgi:predicted regulator of Ras-like GTPase activity (Roadblock/LC7/MglB family)
MNTEAIQQILSEIVRKAPGVKGAFLITEDGFPVISTLETGEEEVRSTAAGAILYDAALKGIRETDLGELEAVATIGTKGYFVVTRAKEGLFLMVSANEDVPLGMVLLRVKKALPGLRDLL